MHGLLSISLASGLLVTPHSRVILSK